MFIKTAYRVPRRFINRRGLSLEGAAHTDVIRLLVACSLQRQRSGEAADIRT